VYNKFISERTVPNLWALHPPFQVDGSLGCMAGTVEMLLQSHEGYIELLPALPDAWSGTGHFEGLVARGNFVVSAEWENGKVTAMTVTSRAGVDCRVRYPGIETASVETEDGQPVQVSIEQAGHIRFSSEKGKTYQVSFTEESRSFLRKIWPW
ncbi:MAG TPA: hypothetical protein VJ904_06155, partial [Tichowtungia sp.]|nr:hypothetical protein [Tichowtungia sp.]